MALHVIGVRHHSPACARLVGETIRRVRPRFVLVEGPADMNDRIAELLLPHKLPIALFTYRQGANGASRSSWSPFCEYAPEWVALRAAQEVGATPLFCDLPAWHPAFDGEENRYADRHTRHSDRLGELCARLGFEDVDALWDHLFEQPLAPDVLAAKLAQYFEALRADEPAGARDQPREDFMARFVAWALSEAGDRDVVFVCGGYHKPAIERTWQAAPAGRPAVAVPEDARVGSYLVPFSFHRLSSFSGYASGMPSPGYYQAVWEEGPEKAAESMLYAAIRHLRAKKQRISPADTIAASTLAAGLRALRGHDALARIDVLDGLAGALVKDALEAPLPWTRRGMLGAHTDPLLVELVAAFTGERRGELAPNTPQPPLLVDAFQELERVGLKVDKTPKSARVKLTQAAGVAQSAVLHRLRILGIPGFRLVRGPVLARGRTDLTEDWSIARQLDTDTALIEASMHGATLSGATAAALEEQAHETTNVRTLASVLEGAALAQLPELTERSIAIVLVRVQLEPALDSLGFTLAKVLALRRGELVLGSRGQAGLEAVVEACFDRGLWLFEGLTGPTAPLVGEQVDAIRVLRDALREHGGLDRERARAVAQRRSRDAEAPPAMRGAGLGFVWSTRDADTEIDPAEAETAAASVRAMAHQRSIGDFLGGLFALAREEMVRVPGLLAAVDAAVTGFLREDFLIALPALRQAFAYFPPRERLGIAQQLLALGGESDVLSADPMQLVGANVDTISLLRGAARDRTAAELARRFGLADAMPDPEDPALPSSRDGAR